MGTGYTYMLDDDSTLTTGRWIKEGLSRAFGVCVTLRDDDMNLTEEQITESLEARIKSSGKYYIENLEKTKKLIKEMKENPDGFFSKEYADYIETVEVSNERSRAKAKKNTERHEKVIQELNKVIQETTDEVTQNIAKFGLEQLEVAKSDREPYLSTIKSFFEFKASKEHSLQRDLEYYQRNLNETIQRETGRAEVYKTIVSEVNRILCLEPTKIGEEK